MATRRGCSLGCPPDSAPADGIFIPECGKDETRPAPLPRQHTHRVLTSSTAADSHCATTYLASLHLRSLHTLSEPASTPCPLPNGPSRYVMGEFLLCLCVCIVQSSESKTDDCEFTGGRTGVQGVRTRCSPLRQSRAPKLQRSSAVGRAGAGWQHGRGVPHPRCSPGSGPACPHPIQYLLAHLGGTGYSRDLVPDHHTGDMEEGFGLRQPGPAMVAGQ